MLQAFRSYGIHRNIIATWWYKLCYTPLAGKNICFSVTCLTLLICTLLTSTLCPASEQTNRAHDIIGNSTITRIQKPLPVRTDQKTLEYFMEHVEELTKHGKDFKKKDLILEVRGKGRYGIQMPSKKITGEFALVEQQPHKVTYLGHGNAKVFFNFSGAIVLEVEYTTQNDEAGPYEMVNTSAHLKFDNAFLGLIAKAAGPILNPRLDKLIIKLAAKTKKIVESAYAEKTGTK